MGQPYVGEIRMVGFSFPPAGWALWKALARLTFDGLVPRATTVDALERFERGSLAEPRDYAWMGWQDAVVTLKSRAGGGRTGRNTYSSV